jgi:uncharacterized protein (DUF2141 family)
MRHTVFPAAILALIFSITSQRTGATEPSESIIEVVPDQLEGRSGNLRCLAFTRSAGFPSDLQSAAAYAEASAASSRPACVFRGLPAGRLAISVIHDADLDGTLSTNLLGVPVEGYGFSRDARGSFGPPSFAKAAFEHDGKPRTLKVRLSY